MSNKKIGLLLINLGTPTAATIWGVYRYLSQFLYDPRVIDLPWLKRLLLVQGAIIPGRVLSSLKAYQTIWRNDGSPLLSYGKRVKNLLQESLGEEVQVELAMRYQSPSIDSALQNLLQRPLDQLVVLPLFPQYASATTGSIFVELSKKLSRFKTIPRLTFIDQFASHPAFIEAFKQQGARFEPLTYDHVLFSFHGLPMRQLLPEAESRFCYSTQCVSTAQGIAQALQLPANHYSISYQSRLGKEPWIGPYTTDTLGHLIALGHKKILVFCPSFVADCLETLYEIEIEYGEIFHQLGGNQLTLVPSLNDHPAWISALKKIAQENFY